LAVKVELNRSLHLTATLIAIVGGHKQSLIEELLPWKFLSRDR